MILFPFIFLGLIELMLRLAGLGTNLSLFVDNPDPYYKDYKMVNQDIGKKYFQKLEYTYPANDIFLKEKPENGIRIIVMGSSTVYGFPYDHNLMFSRILNQMLEETYPSKRIEVVNTAITAINSFTLRDYIDEILAQEPDAILFYAGHNEFYGAFGVGSNEMMSNSKLIRETHLKLMNLRIYQLLRAMINKISKSAAMQKSEQVHGTLMKRIVADKTILYESEDYKAAINSFQENLSAILEKTKRAEVPVFISELISNVRDLEPFESVKTDTLEAAIDVFQRARKALEDSNIPEAENDFYRAKDLDIIRFRASEDVNETIRDLAQKNSSSLVPMMEYYKTYSEEGIIGNKLLTEHVHPNSDGYFLMAKAFYDKLISSELFSDPENTFTSESFDYFKKHYGYTRLDILLGYHRVENLKYHWPFNKDMNSKADYRLIYKPVSFIDSLAFTVMSNSDISLTDMRLKLAKAYEKRKRFIEAYREYEALIRMNPYLSENYNDAASCLLKLNELPLALEYFNRSLQYEKDYFAYFKAGEIYLMQNNLAKAIDYFEKALELAPEEYKAAIKYKLYISLAYSGNNAEAQLIAVELGRTNPNFNLKLPPKRYMYMDYIPDLIAPYIDSARIYLTENELDKAIRVLNESKKIWESPITDRYLAETYLDMGDFKEASRYFNESYPHFNKDPKFLASNLMLLISQGDYKGADKFLIEIKHLDPTYHAINLLQNIVNSGLSGGK